MAQNRESSQGRTKTPWYRSIQIKILISLLIVTTVILGAFATYNVSQERARLNTALEDLARSTTERLAQQLVGPLWTLNQEQVLDLMTAAMLERRIYAVVVRDEDGESVYAGLQRDGDWQVVESAGEPRGEFVSGRKTLLYDGSQKIGVLEVYVTRRFLQEQSENLVVAELQRAGTLYLAFIIVMFILLQRVVVTPISHLTEASERIAAGELKTNIDLDSRDEIGSLGNAINKLQTSLRIAMDRMKEK